ncbi:GNAT family N-acetyltransferase [Nocardia miyunensis]|uniref:GNAT family N-acetyltransferase n=1 Tax=Nocardia miyunensis TaxID=282684 RepID=UPI00082A6314|nr:GNAT family N-acetyltransferase [Nocardia miyunensis]
MLAAADRTNTELYGHADQSSLSVDEFTRPQRGLFIVAHHNDAPVGCGGYRRHHEDADGLTAEIKRMYVEPAVRRLGIARAVLARLEHDAQAAGYHTIILDTGSKQHAAHILYEQCGYRRTASYGLYRDKPGNRAYIKSILRK